MTSPRTTFNLRERFRAQALTKEPEPTPQDIQSTTTQETQEPEQTTQETQEDPRITALENRKQEYTRRIGEINAEISREDPQQHIDRRSLNKEKERLTNAIQDVNIAISGYKNNPEYGSKPSEQRNLIQATHPGIRRSEITAIQDPAAVRTKEQRKQALLNQGKTPEEIRALSSQQQKQALGIDRTTIQRNSALAQREAFVASGKSTPQNFMRPAGSGLASREEVALQREVVRRKLPVTPSGITSGTKGEFVVTTKRRGTLGEQYAQLAQGAYAPPTNASERILAKQGKVVGVRSVQRAQVYQTAFNQPLTVTLQEDGTERAQFSTRTFQTTTIKNPNILQNNQNGRTRISESIQPLGSADSIRNISLLRVSQVEEKQNRSNFKDSLKSFFAITYRPESPDTNPSQLSLSARRVGGFETRIGNLRKLETNLLNNPTRLKLLQNAKNTASDITFGSEFKIINASEIDSYAQKNYSVVPTPQKSSDFLGFSKSLNIKPVSVRAADVRSNQVIVRKDVERSELGKVSQGIVEGFFVSPVEIPRVGITYSAKTLGAIEGLTIGDTRIPGGRASVRRNILSEGMRAGREVERGALSALPGGTPINTEGRIALGTSLLAAFPKAVSSARASAESGVSARGPLVSERFQIPLTADRVVDVKTVGLEVGQRGVTLRSRATIIDQNIPEITSALGKKIRAVRPVERIELADLQSAVPARVTVSGADVQSQLFNLPKVEAARTRQASIIAGELQPDKGLSVSNPQFPIRELPPIQAQRFGKIVEKEVAREGGFFYGSVIDANRLPQGFRNVKIGDIDIKTSLSDAQLGKLTERVSTQARAQGIRVRQSETNPAVIETEGGLKVAEFKGKEVPLEEQALEGFRGVRFKDTTKPFGEARGITQGEQTARKGAASVFINPPTKNIVGGGKIEGLPTAFEEGGVFGRVRPNDPRTLKDVAGFIQGSRGLIALREAQNPITRTFQARSTSRVRRTLSEFEQGFTPEQRAAINEKIAENTGGDIVVIRTPNTARNIPRSLSPRGSLVSPSMVFASPSVVSSSSPNLSPSPSAFPSSSLSPTPSPSLSPSLSVSLSPSPSPSPSPSLSKSPSPSPSPSPSLSKSPSPSPSPSFSTTSKSRFKRPPPFDLPDIGSQAQEGFRVFVKERGIFRPLSGSVFSRDQALFSGASFVERTPSATFEIRPTGSFVTSDEEPEQSRLRGLLAQFRPQRTSDRVKRTGFDPGQVRFIERSKYRISTPGELAGITFKGLRARQGALRVVR